MFADLGYFDYLCASNDKHRNLMDKADANMKNQQMTKEEIYDLLDRSLRDQFARRRLGRAYVIEEVNMDDVFIKFYESSFEIGDLCFTVRDNILTVKKDDLKIGECDTSSELMGWLFFMLKFIIDQRHVKEFIRLCLTCKL